MLLVYCKHLTNDHRKQANKDIFTNNIYLNVETLRTLRSVIKVLAELWRSLVSSIGRLLSC